MASKKKKNDAKFDPFGPQKAAAQGVLNVAKSVASNAQAIGNMVRGAVAGGGGTKSMFSADVPKKTGSSMMSSIKRQAPYHPGVAPKKPVPSLKKIAEEKNRKVPLGPNKPAPRKKSAPARQAPKKKKQDNKGTPYYGMP